LKNDGSFLNLTDEIIQLDIIYLVPDNYLASAKPSFIKLKCFEEYIARATRDLVFKNLEA